jgi:hypothetical protein
MYLLHSCARAEHRVAQLGHAAFAAGVDSGEDRSAISRYELAAALRIRGPEGHHHADDFG